MTERDVDSTIWEPVSDGLLAPQRPLPLTWSVLAPTLEAAQRRTASELKEAINAPLPDGALWQLVAGQPYRRRQTAAAGSSPAAGRAGLLAQIGLGGRASRLLLDTTAIAAERCQRLQRWYARVRATRWGQADLLQVMEEIEPHGILALAAWQQMQIVWQEASQELAQTQAEVWADAPAAAVTALTAPVAAYDLALDRLAQGALSSEEFLQRFGHRGPNEAELAAPRWSEAPDHLTALASARGAAAAGAAARQAQAEQTLLGHVRFLRRRAVETLLQTRQRYGEQLHQADDARALWLAATRIWTLAAAQEALADQRLQQPDDIFFLELEEVKQLMTGEWNVTHRSQLYDLVASRRHP